MTNERTIEPDTRHSRGWRVAGWGAAAALLALPALAMQVTGEVDWGPEDFAVFGLMLLTAGLAIEAGTRLVRGAKGRAVLVGAVVLAFLLVWAELAVGIFD